MAVRAHVCGLHVDQRQLQEVDQPDAAVVLGLRCGLRWAVQHVLRGVFAPDGLQCGDQLSRPSLFAVFRLNNLVNQECRGAYVPLLAKLGFNAVLSIRFEEVQQIQKRLDLNQSLQSVSETGQNVTRLCVLIAAHVDKISL